MKNSGYYSMTILAFCIVLQSCAPIFSELQSARMVGEDQFEITPSFSQTSYTEDGASEFWQLGVGVQAAYGLHEKVDIRMRAEHIFLDLPLYGVTALAFGPKFSLIEDRLAFYLPVATAFGEYYEGTWEIHPSLICTVPAVADKLDINFSTKYLVMFCEDCLDPFAVNLGLAISTDLNKWAIRPEYGILKYPGETYSFGQFSIGFTKSFGK